MKTFIIAALTADGFIGHGSQHLSTHWTAASDKRFFTRRTKEAGVTLFGRTTFDTFSSALKGRRTIVYTTRPESVTAEGVEVFSGTPKQLLEKLKNEGVQELAICGGTQIYQLFLREGLVDEIYLNIHPLLFGAGVTLCAERMDCKLMLLDSQDIGDGVMSLHYKVLANDAT